MRSYKKVRAPRGIRTSDIKVTMVGDENGMTLADVSRGVDGISDFVDAWLGWRHGNMVPSREQVNLQDIKQLLPRVIVMEVCSPREIFVRLAGSAYLDIFGVELTGQNYVDMAPPQDRELRGRRLWEMISRPCGGYSSVPHPNPNKQHESIHGLSLPMRSGDKFRPMQLFSIVASEFQNIAPEANADVGMVAHLADRFSFVDIGAGLPSDF